MNQEMQLHGHSKVVIDDPGLMETIEIRRALDALDADALSAVADASADKRGFYERLSHQSAHVCFQVGQKAARPLRQTAYMKMVPVITAWPAVTNETVRPGDPWEKVMLQVQQALADWVGSDRHIVRLFAQGIPYGDVCHWSAIDLQKIIKGLVRLVGHVPRREGAEWQNGFRPGMPTLRLLVSAVQSPFGDVIDYAASEERNDLLLANLTATIGAGLGLRPPAPADSARPPWADELRVLLPDEPGEALLAGVCAWIEMLADGQWIEAWDLHWVIEGMAVLALRLRDSDQAGMMILRAHQIGLDGIEQVVAFCYQRLGPNANPPSIPRH